MIILLIFHGFQNEKISIVPSTLKFKKIISINVTFLLRMRNYRYVSIYCISGFKQLIFPILVSKNGGRRNVGKAN
jgi:hypothetical protein